MARFPEGPYHNLKVNCMFGLFSSKNDDSKVAYLASEIEEIFSSLFPDEEVPSAFVEEPYVQGYIIGYSTAVMDIRFEAVSWTTERKGRFQLDLYQKIAFTKSCDFDRFLRDIDFARKLSLNPGFCRGRDQAAVCAVVFHDKLRTGITDPLIHNARIEADKLQIDIKTAILLESLGSFKLMWHNAT